VSKASVQAATTWSKTSFCFRSEMGLLHKGQGTGRVVVRLHGVLEQIHLLMQVRPKAWPQSRAQAQAQESSRQMAQSMAGRLGSGLEDDWKQFIGTGVNSRQELPRAAKSCQLLRLKLHQKLKTDEKKKLIGAYLVTDLVSAAAWFATP
jgi:hypothetical protein